VHDEKRRNNVIAIENQKSIVLKTKSVRNMCAKKAACLLQCIYGFVRTRKSPKSFLVLAPYLPYIDEGSKTLA
jgi:hypothetical protein